MVRNSVLQISVRKLDRGSQSVKGPRWSVTETLEESGRARRLNVFPVPRAREQLGAASTMMARVWVTAILMVLCPE